ncbi:helix-turn-helix domain-containing protein [Sulfitobacter sp. 1A15106]|uniref:helix-turn-helix domain-containing protein n=1 Tax=Sulfitobacter sp. 1A15106 TaxID=3368590 RepID=UPI003745BF2C
MNWANVVKRYRERTGMLQKQLAHQLGVDSVTVSRWERGVTEPNLIVKRQLRAEIPSSASSSPAVRCILKNSTKAASATSLSTLRVRAVNELYCELYGVTEDEVVGKDWRDVSSDWLREEGEASGVLRGFMTGRLASARVEHNVNLRGKFLCGSRKTILRLDLLGIEPLALTYSSVCEPVRENRVLSMVTMEEAIEAGLREL